MTQSPSNLLLNLCQSVLICAICGFSALGCMNARIRGDRPAMFEPVQMRINPTFTRFRSFDADAVADGLEADIELRDEFGDATKGGGFIYFELYDYVADGADVRGPQVGEAVRYDLASVEAQRQHWQNVVRTYRFRLPWGELDAQKRYVLSATYLPGQSAAGERLFDRLVILPRRVEE